MSGHRRRVVGVSSAVGAFLAWGLSPVSVPPARADVEDLFGPSGWEALFDPGPAADSTFADAFQTDFWLPVHAMLQDWITSDVGQQVDSLVNTVFAPLTPTDVCGLNLQWHRLNPGRPGWSRRWPVVR